MPQEQSRQTTRRRITTALAVCMFSSASSNSHGAESVPVLVRTTTPIRVVSETYTIEKPGIPFSMPSDVDLKKPVTSPVRSVELARKSSPEFRALMNPRTTLGAAPTTSRTSDSGIGKTRTNLFVDFHGDQPSPIKVNRSTVPAAKVSSQRTYGSGKIKTNPLVVDSPPKLRRFSADESLLQSSRLPSETVSDLEAETGLRIARHNSPPNRDVADPSDALDALSLDSEPANALLDTARDGGFGLLAIDQIGDHLPKTADLAPAAEAVIAQRFPNDIVANDPAPSFTERLVQDTKPQDDDGSLRDQLSLFDANEVVAKELPMLPAPQSSIDAAIATVPDTEAFDPLPSPYLPSADGPAAQEVDALIGSISTQEKIIDLDLSNKDEQRKPNIAERFSSWANRIKGGSKSKTTAAAGTNLNQLELKPKRKSTGLFQRFFKK